ncbi:hypothetical protein [Leuconostoc sp.]|uniref:hypothetical protein n=1 Tax=Leuconostoc sp. TaxID=1930076 RepID=UPI002649A0F1|nr:hypothetical protein [Leuconostoc sp.]MDN6068797.1 hypothetical protein [Leuconostoc sp.]MDN6084937.1 hypothetical protein [Lactococcus plantarum]
MNPPTYFPEIGQDDFLSAAEMRKHLTAALGTERAERIAGFELGPLSKRVDLMTAWRIEGTLREFPKFDSVNLWFNYPLHYSDDAGVLKDLEPVGATDNKWQKGGKNSSDTRSSEEKKAERAKKNTENLISAFTTLDIESKGELRIGELVDYFGKSRNTVKNWIDNQDILKIDSKGIVSFVEKNKE